MTKECKNCRHWVRIKGDADWGHCHLYWCRKLDVYECDFWEGKTPERNQWEVL